MVASAIDNVPHILRPGKITAEEIKQVAGNVIIDKHILGKLEPNKKVLSPGMKYKHYAPKTECVLVYDTSIDKIQEKLIHTAQNCISNGKVPTIMCSNQNFEFLRKNLDENIHIINLGSDLNSISKNIFSDLRKADTYNSDLIIIEGVATDGLGLAIMNRLLRACNYNVI